MTGPLQGLRVVELASIGPGPMCCMLLADLGADVIRVDRLEPSGLGVAMDKRFEVNGRGRRSVAIDTRQAAGRDAAMKELFRQNRVVSSIGGDLDQKSCWEVLTDPDIAGRHYNAEERQGFRRHVLWTRVLSNRRTRLPRGDTGDLLEHVRHERETLVLKPNRAFGGQGVQIGLLMTQAEWESAMEEALKGPDRWVVQERASIPASEFPVVGPERTAHLEPFYTVMGFAATRSGVAVFGRASQKQVVNVANRGGMCVVMVGRTPGKLHGPQRLRNGAR